MSFYVIIHPLYKGINPYPLKTPIRVDFFI